MVTWKYPELQDEFRRLDKRIIIIHSILEHIFWELYRQPTRITCVFRRDGGVHEFWRGLDIDVMEGVPLDKQEDIRRGINEMFYYGDGVHETVPNLAHGTASHWHVQCIHQGGWYD